MAHHERWDGGGYPNALAGDRIPIEARIIAVADAYDAMTSKRSYRHPMKEKEAIEELKANAGRQFDPRVVDVLLNDLLIIL
jgi:HD-GYP domain-containing protein (c-di-GMP phosphodiesterase class II)